MRAYQVLVPLLALATSHHLAGCKDAKSKDGKTVTPVQAPKTVAASASAAPDRPALVRSHPLPKLAGAALRERMRNHGDDTENLLWSTLMLDFESTDGIASRIIEAPTLSRPNPGDLDTINAMLPSEFFDLQDQLDTAVRALRTAARAKDDVAMAAQYGQVVQTCIQCHSLYLRFPAPE